MGKSQGKNYRQRHCNRRKKKEEDLKRQFYEQFRIPNNILVYKKKFK